MGFTLKPGEKNAIPKGTVIFAEKETVNHVAAVLSGKVMCKNDYVQLPIVKGGFIGTFDVSAGRYVFEYVAEEDSVIFPFPVSDDAGFRTMFQTYNKDYRGLLIGSDARFFSELLKLKLKYLELSKLLYTTLSDCYKKYVDACRNGGMAVDTIEELESIKPFEDNSPFAAKTATAFLELNAVPANVMSAFFSGAIEMTMQTVNMLSVGICDLFDAVSEVGRYVYDHYTYLYNDGELNLLSACIKLYKNLEKAGRADKSLLKICETLSEVFDKCEETALVGMGAAHPVKRERLGKLMESLSTGEDIQETTVDSSVADEDLYRSLKNSMKTILSFAKADESVAHAFENAVNAFVDSKDRFSTEDAGRQMRRKVAEHFYTIYRHVFLNSLEANIVPRPVDLFLNFGYVDERLVTREEAISLCKLKVATKQKYSCHIYTLYEWLSAVYNGKREPSKNEFDMEYNETLRELKKAHEIDDEEEKRRLRDPELRLEFEVNNMFKLNHRVVNGQPSTFVPILCSEQMTAEPFKALITKDRIGQLVDKYRDLDIGVFRREQMFADKELKIEKEIIQLEVFPDIVLLPAYGTNASMWQEISCKKRDSAGRFLFPIMMDGSVDDILIRVLGRFRWELCRTMQGTAWNNIQYKSLTSEYSDYIQFYKKNHDLSDERKEKVKTQLVKAKNNAREVFVQDYEQWIKSESAGGQKLNKPSREILAMYCPFNAETRKRLESQPAFAEALGRYNRETQKKVHELELRHHALLKVCPEIPELLLDTLHFYRDM
jgi:hypothetical protein